MRFFICCQCCWGYFSHFGRCVVYPLIAKHFKSKHRYGRDNPHPKHHFTFSYCRNYNGETAIIHDMLMLSNPPLTTCTTKMCSCDKNTGDGQRLNVLFVDLVHPARYRYMLLNCGSCACALFLGIKCHGVNEKNSLLDPPGYIPPGL